LWSGTAASFVDLNPAGFTFSAGHGVFGNVQVGNGEGLATGNRSHALLWSGTAGSWQDLHQYLASSGINFNSSVALGIDSNGNIIGSARVLNDEHSYAILWSPGAVPEPSTSLSLGLLAVMLSTIQGPYRTIARRMAARRSRRN
jgi:hypothetical protein